MTNKFYKLNILIIKLIKKISLLQLEIIFLLTSFRRGSLRPPFGIFQTLIEQSSEAEAITLSLNGHLKILITHQTVFFSNLTKRDLRLGQCVRLRGAPNFQLQLDQFFRLAKPKTGRHLHPRQQ